jgi:hypothetical protein
MVAQIFMNYSNQQKPGLSFWQRQYSRMADTLQNPSLIIGSAKPEDMISYHSRAFVGGMILGIYERRKSGCPGGMESILQAKK